LLQHEAPQLTRHLQSVQLGNKRGLALLVGFVIKDGVARLFAGLVPFATQLRLWDVFFTGGSAHLLCAGVALLSMNAEQLMASHKPLAMQGLVAASLGDMVDPEPFVQRVCSLERAASRLESVVKWCDSSLNEAKEKASMDTMDQMLLSELEARKELVLKQQEDAAHMAQLRQELQAQKEELEAQTEEPAHSIDEEAESKRKSTPRMRRRASLAGKETRTVSSSLRGASAGPKGGVATLQHTGSCGPCCSQARWLT